MVGLAIETRHVIMVTIMIEYCLGIILRALTMVRFVGKGHLNDQNPFFGQILVRHLTEKLAFSEFSYRYRII